MIPLFSVNMAHKVALPLLETLYSGYITEGPRVKEFERALMPVVGTAHVAAVNSGTSALTLALKVAGVGPGDEVITTPMTCTATNLPILTLGARPVWADVNQYTGLIDPADVNRKITAKTRAVMCVDWGGAPCGHLGVPLPVIEDAAHAIGAEWQGRKVGTHNELTCFSFQAIKHLTTVDGGALCSTDPELIARAKKLRWFGIDRDAPCPGDSRVDVDIDEAGYKMHMNDVAATIGLAQLPTLEDILQNHRLTARYYDNFLDPQFGRPPSEGSSFWMYTVILPRRGLQDDFAKHMARCGVHVSRVHRRNDEYSVFKEYAAGELPGLDSFAQTMMCLPVHTQLTNEDLTKITEAANQFASRKF